MTFIIPPELALLREPHAHLIFRAIPGYRLYEVSECGTIVRRIWGQMAPVFNKNQSYIALTQGLQLVKGKQDDGYYYVTLCYYDLPGSNGSVIDGCKTPKRIAVHTLVALTWVGPKPGKNYWVNHEDGNKQNNHRSNLKWGTIAYNIQHSIDTKLRIVPTGKDHWKYGKSLTADTKQLMSAAKLGELHPKFKGWYITPLGRFVTSALAAAAHDTYNAFIIRKCARGKDGWSFEPKQPSSVLLNIPAP